MLHKKTVILNFSSQIILKTTTLIIKNFLEHQIKRISEGSCNTEEWSNG